jgi:hypothetical protein
MAANCTRHQVKERGAMLEEARTYVIAPDCALIARA